MDKDKLAIARAAFAARLKSFACIAALIVGSAALALVATPLGRHLEVSLALEPMQALQRRLGLNPKPHPSMRFILLEDRALARLKRVPTLSEWIDVALRLEELGFERVLFLGFQMPTDAVDAAGRRAESFVQGVVDVRDGKNLRAMPTRALPPQFRIVAPPSRGFAVSEYLLGLAPDQAARLGGAGILNLPNAYEMPAAVATLDGELIPNIGLLAARTLAYDAERGFVSDGDVVPLSRGGRLMVSYLDYRDVLPIAIAANVFLAARPGAAPPPLSPETRKKLAGGRVAVIAPDAWTGTRFVETGIGAMPSFMAPASIANSMLTGRHLAAPCADATAVVPSALAFWAALVFARKRRAAEILGVALVGVGAVGVGSFFGAGLFLPTVQIAIVAAAAVSVAMTDRALETFRARVASERDLALGQSVQRLMFPAANTGTFGAWSYRIEFMPYGAMSGDWYQVFRSPDGEAEPFVLIAVGDVVGKGASAALSTAVVAAVWSSHAERWRGTLIDARERLQDLVNELDRSLRAAFHGSQNTTLSLALLTQDELHVAALASPPWISVARNGEIERQKTKRGNPVGLGEVASKIEPLTLDAATLADAVILTYTDGVMDGSRSRSLFASELEGLGGMPDAVDDRFRILARALRAAGKDSTLPDDSTIVMIHRGVAAKAPEMTSESA